jgi:hypothetical protein
VKSRLLLDIVVRKGATVLELLSGENQTLLVRWDSFLVLNLRLDVVDRVRGLDVERDRLSGESLDKDLQSGQGKEPTLRNLIKAIRSFPSSASSTSYRYMPKLGRRAHPTTDQSKTANNTVNFLTCMIAVLLRCAVLIAVVCFFRNEILCRLYVCDVRGNA